MIELMNILHYTLPLFGLITLCIGMKLSYKNFILLSVWVSLLALILHYQQSGGELFGAFFNYQHASIYTANLIVLIIAVIYMLYTLRPQLTPPFWRYGASLLSAGLIVAGSVLLINLWVNARFVEHRLPGTPVMQVGVFNQLPYCNKRYIFYKININHKVTFMCPNYYGLFPAIGELDKAPDFVIKQLPARLQNIILPHFKT